jgi:hypothetical protein
LFQLCLSHEKEVATYFPVTLVVTGMPEAIKIQF